MEGHQGLPKEFGNLNITAYRLQSHPKFEQISPSRSAILSWDVRRVYRAADDFLAEHVLSSIASLPSAVKRIPLIVSGSKAFAESLCQELQREVFWLSIDGGGATDLRALWDAYLLGVPSSTISLDRSVDGKIWYRLGSRELRLQPSSPALTQMLLLRASIALLEPIFLAKCTNPDYGSLCAVHSFSSKKTKKKFELYFQAIRLATRIAYRTIHNQLSRSGKLVEQWSIGIAKTSESSSGYLTPALLRSSELVWIDPGPNRFIADPFFVDIGDTTTLFFEELCFFENKGRLKAMSLDASGKPTGEEVTILDKSFHLSFPHVFEHPSDPNALFLLPEQATANKLVLYRSEKVSELIGLRFEESITLLENFQGIDPIIQEWEGNFYLFVTNGSYGNFDNNLHLFVAEKLCGPYAPHVKNPIKLGLRGCRMAGPLLEHDGSLLRPSQDCLPRYGSSVILYQIDTLTPTEYMESEKFHYHVEENAAFGSASHTVVWHKHLFATDGVRKIVDARNPTSQPTENGSTPVSGRDRAKDIGSLANHSINYLGGSVVAMIGGLVMLPIYTRALSTAEYGILETTLRFVSVCMLVAFLGLRQAYARLFFEDDLEQRKRILTSTTLITNILVSFVIMFPLILLGSLLASRFGFPFLPVASSIALATWLAFESTFMIGLSYLQVRLQSRQFVLAQSCRVVLLVALNFTLLHFFEMGVSGALLGNLVAAVISGGIAGFLLFKYSGFGISVPALKEMTSFGLPYIPSALFGYVFGNADRFAIIYFGEIAALGLLALASKIGEMALSIVFMPIDNVWSPFAFSVHKDTDGPKRIGRLFTLYVALCILLALVVSLAAPLAVSALATPSYQFAAELVPIVAIGWTFSVLATLSDIGILIAKQTRLKPLILAAGACIALSLQFLLTPFAGIVGSAVATTLTLIAHFIITRTVANRYFRFTTQSKDFLVMSIAAGFAYFIGREIARALPMLPGSIFGIAFAISFYTYAMHKSGVISFSELIHVAKNSGLSRFFALRKESLGE